MTNASMDMGKGNLLRGVKTSEGTMEVKLEVPQKN